MIVPEKIAHDAPRDVLHVGGALAHELVRELRQRGHEFVGHVMKDKFDVLAFRFDPMDDAVDERGNTIGLDLTEQTRQVLLNIEKILEASGGKPENIVKLTIHLLHGQDPARGFQAFQERWGRISIPPAVTVVFISGLGKPDWLIEIDAVAEVAI